MVVPSIGLSRHLGACLESLRASSGVRLQLILVAQAWCPEPALAGPGEIVPLSDAVGFARAANAGLSRGDGEFVAVVNDDALVAPDWLASLVEALARDAGASSAQGTNLSLSHPDLADGCGLAWNRDWQAVQLGHGRSAPAGSEPISEIFGVSGTAAVYRRAALAALETRTARPFEERLFAYYEDVDLACRLRARGGRALWVPGARARHAGGASASGLRTHPARLVYANRVRVLARLLGRRLPGALPRIVLRDAFDLAGAVRRREWSLVRAITAGWWDAVRTLRDYAHTESSRVTLDEVRRLSAEAWSEARCEVSAKARS